MRTALVAYGVGLVRRRWRRNAAVGFVFALTVFLLAATLLVTTALREALLDTVADLPDLTVQRLEAGRQAPIPTERLFDIAALPGVSWATERVWGYQWFAPGAATFTVVGVDPWLAQDRPAFTAAVERVGAAALERGDTAIVGDGVAAAVAGVYLHTEHVPLTTPTGETRRLAIVGRVEPGAALLGDDLVLAATPTVRGIFGLPDDLATDIVARVDNPEEIDTIARKIRARWPDVRVVTAARIARSYRATFDFGGGVLLLVGVVLLLAFFVLVFDRASGVTSEERREVGILRALGWRVSDVLAVKLVESGFVALVAVLAGLAAALAYVHVLDAPGLVDALAGWSPVPDAALPATLRAGPLLLAVFVAVPVYVGATLIPAWRIATLEPDEVMR